MLGIEQCQYTVTSESLERHAIPYDSWPLAHNLQISQSSLVTDMTSEVKKRCYPTLISFFLCVCADVYINL